ncbi:CBS domain-containing protein [Pontibacterium granulatum]|uniref:CBS domain-containing protein n=1 Tax=Pontibacterium granulatum TaxID=2036029 RepID=UPI00249AB251|nr:CBS domain-containing protein [Pontibacterium granulatum]MDI3323351.1 CBS domain-containing protein [Pontibacterium granulatum]
MTKQARDIMSHDLFVVSPEMSLVEMDKALATENISGAPVMEDGTLVGIVTSTDIGQTFSNNLKSEEGEASYYWHSNGTLTSLIFGADADDSALADRIRACKVADIMTRKVISVDPHDDVKKVAQLMTEYKIHRVIVVENDKPVGIITSLDMVGLLGQ